MARPKSYDRDAALRRACEAFWAHGYGALGVRAIEHQTGLNQFAIQTEFGGKEGLLVEALEFYADKARQHALRPLKDGGIAAIAAFFHRLVTDGSPTSSKWGCLLVNSGIENAEIKSARIEAVSDAYWRTLRQHFATALRRSIDAGEVADNLDVADITRALVTAVIGIHTANRIAGSNRAGAPLVRMIERQIESWRI
jgi:TetR/AcrR family transcriptional regulator, transcriptional repressor for nem operon